MVNQENIRFLRAADDIGALVAGASVMVNLDTFHTMFGQNFNTMNITNNASEEISIKLDGIKSQFIKGNGGILSFDWQDGIIYSQLEVTNEAATDTSANEIRISVGRTGFDKKGLGV
jgi:hypothetical protein